MPLETGAPKLSRRTQTLAAHKRSDQPIRLMWMLKTNTRGSRLLSMHINNNLHTNLRTAACRRMRCRRMRCKRKAILVACNKAYALAA